jgi:hypothetical protein
VRPKCIGILACAAMCAATALASGAEARSINIGRDVGDGQTRYDIPYDPKSVGEMLFIAPTPEHPYYEIVAPMGDWDGGAGASVSKVRVNGLDIESFYLFVDGFSHVQGNWITRDAPAAKNIVLVARALWHNNEAVTLEADISGPSPATRSVSGTAPATGGGPEGWRRYQSVVLREEVGVDRRHEPVEFSVTVRAEDATNLEKELRLYAVDPESGALTPLPLQTFNPKRFLGQPPGTSETDYLFHPSQSIEGVFLADVPANDARVYVLVYDNPDAPAPSAPATDLKVTGDAPGFTVENEFFTVRLDSRSGQIASIDLKGRPENPVPRLTNSYSYAVHWNPDSFSDNGLWGHTFGWNPPDHTLVSANGPLMFRITNRGRMPDRTPQVYASVTYTFYAGVPYIKCTTSTEVREPLNASAIRNGEIVLDSHLITHFVWQEKNGDLRTIPTLHGPNYQDEWTTRVEHDVPWLAMTHEPDDYGIGAIVEDSLQFNPIRGEATTHRPAYYIYYHHMWQIPVTYFTRAWVYPFSDYQRGPILPVDVGSTYVERLAFMPFFLGEGDRRYAAIEAASEQIHNPLSARWGR